ncbi:hypothetical protein F4680DRAFT_312326 [Xylaria scruposa]|nr:hypothetical protein F4680DRAFT_312326 [Xylaria scruposa]
MHWAAFTVIFRYTLGDTRDDVLDFDCYDNKFRNNIYLWSAQTNSDYYAKIHVSSTCRIIHLVFSHSRVSSCKSRELYIAG